MLSRASGGKRKRGKERVTHRNFAKKILPLHFEAPFQCVSIIFSKICTCLSHKRKLLVCKSQLLFSVGFEVITKIEGAIFFETPCTCTCCNCSSTCTCTCFSCICICLTCTCTFCNFRCSCTCCCCSCTCFSFTYTCTCCSCSFTCCT